MRWKFFFYCALLTGVLSGGCVSPPQSPSAKNSGRLYFHLFASFIYPQSLELIVSGPIPAAGDFDIPMAGNEHVKGHITPKGEKFVVHFEAPLCSGWNVYDGEVGLEERDEPAPRPYDSNAPFICQPHFVISLKHDPKSILKLQADAEKKEWRRRNPLTARELRRVERNFHLVRPGMKEAEVFAVLGIAQYENRLVPSSAFNWRPGNYLLSDEERLVLGFQNPNFDSGIEQSDRIVVQAELDRIVWTVENGTNVTPRWRAFMQMPEGASAPIK